MILKITLIGLLAGVIGTGMGGVISAVFKKNVDKYLSFFMGISGGIMLAVVVFDLMNESMEEMGIAYTSLFVLIGVLITMYIKNKLDIPSDLKSGYLVFISILLHNLPEGLAIGSSFISEESFGITLAIIIGIHNIPEGVAMALSLVGSKIKIQKVIGFTLLAGVPMGVGSFLGGCFGIVFNSLMGIFLSLAAGTMIYVVLEEIFPKSTTLYCIIGFLVGTIIVKCI